MFINYRIFFDYFIYSVARRTLMLCSRTAVFSSYERTGIHISLVTYTVYLSVSSAARDCNRIHEINGQ